MNWNSMLVCPLPALDFLGGSYHLLDLHLCLAWRLHYRSSLMSTYSVGFTVETSMTAKGVYVKQ